VYRARLASSTRPTRWSRRIALRATQPLAGQIRGLTGAAAGKTVFAMATVPPPEEPTEQILPRPAAIVHEPVGAPVVESTTLLRLEQVIAGLRTWIAVLGAVALAAVAVAVYALIKANDNSPGSHGGFATNARVDRISADVKALRAGGGSTGTTGGATTGVATGALSARVDQLTSQVRSLSAAGGGGGGSQAALSGRVTALESSVRSLASRPASGANVTQSLAQLSTRVDSIASDVAALKQAQSQSPAP
jgi:outer membrane murein-binding lipoprotein Lpp